MKINPDAVRETLLYLEERQTMTCGDDCSEIIRVPFKEIIGYLVTEKNFSQNDAVYAIAQLSFNDMLDTSLSKNKPFRGKLPYGFVNDITWLGHDFLNIIRSDELWEQIKQKASEYGAGVPLNVLAMIASKAFTAIL